MAKVREDVKLPLALTARRMSAPTRTSYACDLHTLRFLNRTAKRVKTFGGGGRASLKPLQVPTPLPLHGSHRDFRPHGLGDSNLEDPTIEPRSMCGLVLMLAGAAVHASASKQPSTAVDTTAAETFAQSSLAALGVLYMQTLDELSYIFEELADFTSSPLRLYCDNAATVLISQDATSAKRVPYIMRRVAFLLELTGAREIVLVKIGTDFNAADLFTKVLAVEKFDTFTAYVLGER